MPARTNNPDTDAQGGAGEQPGHYVAYMPLDEIPSADRNPKGHAAAEIGRSIDRHGVAELPLLDERTGKLVAGHGRRDQLIAMRDAGQDPPGGIRLNTDGAWTCPVLRGWSSRSDAEADAYLVGSNRLTEIGGWDDRVLAEILDELADQQLLDVTGYTDDDLTALLADIDQPDASGDGDGGGAPGSADLLDPPDDDKYKSKYGVIVECGSEDEQEQIYETLRGDGYNCRVVSV